MYVAQNKLQKMHFWFISHRRISAQLWPLKKLLY